MASTAALVAVRNTASPSTVREPRTCSAELPVLQLVEHLVHAPAPLAMRAFPPWSAWRTSRRAARSRRGRPGRRVARRAAAAGAWGYSAPVWIQPPVRRCRCRGSAVLVEGFQRHGRLVAMSPGSSEARAHEDRRDAVDGLHLVDTAGERRARWPPRPGRSRPRCGSPRPRRWPRPPPTGPSGSSAHTGLAQDPDDVRRRHVGLHVAVAAPPGTSCHSGPATSRRRRGRRGSRRRRDPGERLGEGSAQAERDAVGPFPDTRRPSS